MALFLAELTCQQQGMSAGAATEIFQRLASAGGINGHRAQQLAQLFGAGSIEGTAGAAAEPRDLLECRLGYRIAALVKQEDRQAQHAQLTGEIAKLVDPLLHRVADEDQGVDVTGFGFRAGMAQGAANLGPPAQAPDPRHPPGQFAGGTNPARGFELAETPIKDELDIEPTQRGGFREHLSLQLAGA